MLFCYLCQRFLSDTSQNHGLQLCPESESAMVDKFMEWPYNCGLNVECSERYISHLQEFQKILLKGKTWSINLEWSDHQTWSYVHYYLAAGLCAGWSISNQNNYNVPSSMPGSRPSVLEVIFDFVKLGESLTMHFILDGICYVIVRFCPG